MDPSRLCAYLGLGSRGCSNRALLVRLALRGNVLYRSTSHFSKSSGVTTVERLAKRSRAHPLPECVHDHGLFCSTYLYDMRSEVTYVFLQGLPLELFHVEEVVRDRGWGPVA